MNVNLLIVFIAITTLAVLIQTGIATGLLVALVKTSQQADRAVSEVRRLLEPVQKAINAIETASVEVSKFGASSQHTLRAAEKRWEETLERFRKKVA